MHKNIEFDAEGVTLRGWFYTPDGAEGPVPTIVMAHGFSGIKEQYLDDFAAAFAAAGLAALVFDHRNFGESDGEPRQEIDPVQQIRDYRHGITYAQTLPEVDGDSIGVWGSSYSGGHVIVVAATDRRVKCVVAQVPSISGPDAALRRLRPDLVGNLAHGRRHRPPVQFAGAPPVMIPVFAEDDATPCALPGGEGWDFLLGTAARAPTYRNEVTLRSGEMAREYEPGTWVHRVSPTPLLMIVADKDTVTPTDLALDAFERAREPKQLVLLSGGHFAPYSAQFDEASAAAVAWFEENLLG